MFFIIFLHLILSEKIYITEFNTWARDGNDKITFTAIDDYIHVVHTGNQDFSISSPPANMNTANQGDVYQIGVEVYSPDAYVQTSVAPYNENTVISYGYANSQSSKLDSIEELTAYILCPAKTTSLSFRIVGNGPCEFDFRNYWYEFKEHFNIPTENFTLSNNKVEALINPQTFEMQITDKITKRIWRQREKSTTNLIITELTNLNQTYAKISAGVGSYET